MKPAPFPARHPAPRRHSGKGFRARGLIGFVLAVASAGWAISPSQVRQLLSAGQKITFVDVRLNVLFQRGHIPGAINIPAQLVPQKQLPPLGHVVVYDRGLGGNAAAAAAAALNQKNGITAEVLDGGYAAWETARAATTRPGGMKPEVEPVITYAQLKQAQGPDVVLVDLRRKAPNVSNGSAARTASAQIAAAPLTDLQAEFPNARVTRSPFDFAASRLKLSAGGVPPPLLVLIDNGDGRAEAMARKLKANGIKRYVVLAGGEQILAVHGQAGLERIGSSVNVRIKSAAPRASSR